jgi:uncharacterized protein
MIFVDTSAWLALADSRDRDHARALAVHRRILHGEFGKQVTSNYVMTETLTIVRRRMGVAAAVALSTAVAHGTEVGLFWIESVHHNEAVALMAEHPDKDWSLTDCSSFVIMRALGVQNAFTLDHDFAQAGFSTRP